MSKSQIRLISYNIHKGFSPLNKRFCLDQMGQCLDDCCPDIVCLQEVQGQHDKRLRTIANYPDLCQSQYLGRQLGLFTQYGKNCTYPYGHHGNAILSRFCLTPIHNLNISTNHLEQRGLLHCNVVIGGQQVAVLCCHLNLRHKDRIIQYNKITAYIHQHIDKDCPLILAGDFNDWTKQADNHLKALALSESTLTLTGNYAHSFPAKLPLLPLDRIYVRHLKVLELIDFSDKKWQSLSDHLPVGVVLGL